MPFSTHHRALDMPLDLRVSSELHLEARRRPYRSESCRSKGERVEGRLMFSRFCPNGQGFTTSAIGALLHENEGVIFVGYTILWSVVRDFARGGRRKCLDAKVKLVDVSYFLSLTLSSFAASGRQRIERGT